MKSEKSDRILTWIAVLSGFAMLLLSVWLYSTQKAYNVTAFLGVEYQEPQEYEIYLRMNGAEPKVFCYEDSTKPGVSQYRDEHGSWLRLFVKPQEYRSWDAYEVRYQSDEKGEEPDIVLNGKEPGERNQVSLYDSSIQTNFNILRYVYLLFGGFCFILSLVRLRRVKRSPSQEYVLDLMDRERRADLDNPMWEEAENWFRQWKMTAMIRSLCFVWTVLLVYYGYIFYLNRHMFWGRKGIFASMVWMLFLLLLLKIFRNIQNVRTATRFSGIYMKQCRPGAFAAASAEAYRSGHFFEMSLGKSYGYHANLAVALSSWGRNEESLKYQTLFWKETRERTKKKWFYAHYHNIRRNNNWWLGRTEAVLKEQELIWSFLETHEKAGKVRIVGRGLDIAKVLADIGDQRWREARDGAIALLQGAQTEWERFQLYDMMVKICRESGDKEGAKRYMELLRQIVYEPGAARFSGIEPEKTPVWAKAQEYQNTSIRIVNNVEVCLVLAGILIIIVMR